MLLRTIIAVIPLLLLSKGISAAQNYTDILEYEFNIASGVFDTCRLEGNPKPKRLRTVNRYKNRFIAPAPEEIDSTVTLRALLGRGNDRKRWSQLGAVSIEGWVYEVKKGGIETCNCKDDTDLIRDTHIELVASPRSTSSRKRFIVEVTPRFRYLMAKQDIDWTTNTLQELKGKKVRITGWLFFDDEHDDEAWSTDPTDIGQKNWRATAWEIHPITNIEIVE